MKSRRREHNHQLVAREILATARTIMREEGAAALTMQELARRMEMRAPSLYNYFAGKNEIYDALFRLGYEQYAAYLDEHVTGAETWQATLRQYLEAYMSYALDNPELYQLCFERPMPGFVPSPASLELSFGVLKRGYSVAARWQAATDSNLSAQQMADLVLAVMHGLTALHLANEPSMPVGRGRFGSLIPAAVALFDEAWSHPRPPEGENR